jgi:hypothetical protein
MSGANEDNFIIANLAGVEDEYGFQLGSRFTWDLKAC